MMDAALFGRLVDSMTEMDEIVCGECAPSREFHVDAVEVRKIRQSTACAGRLRSAVSVEAITFRR